MSPSNPAKFGAAFLAGLVVALASAMIYVKTGGFHGRDAALVSSVQQVKQPDVLNSAKAEEAAPAVKAVNPPVTRQEAPVAARVTAPAVAPPPANRQTAGVKPAAHVSTHHVRSHRARFRPHYTPPESQGAIRVEVSQIKPATYPVSSASAQPPLPVPAAAPIPTMSEDQPAGSVNAPAPAPEQPHVVTLPEGTTLIVRLGETLSTNHNYPGDTFRATLDRPIIADGFIIADKGSKVLGKITALDKSGKFEGTSSLQLALTEIHTTDGQRVHIQTGFVDRRGPANNGASIAKVGGGAALGAIIGAIAGGGKGAAIGAGAGGALGAGTVMLGKGRPAVIGNETQLTFQLSSPTTITEHLN